MSRELDALIAEQQKDMRFGHRVWSMSLDAPRYGDGEGTRLDHVMDSGEGYGVMTRPSGRYVKAIDLGHGAYGYYTNLACRCAKCRAANTQASRNRRAMIRAELAAIRATYASAA